MAELINKQDAVDAAEQELREITKGLDRHSLTYGFVHVVTKAIECRVEQLRPVQPEHRSRSGKWLIRRFDGNAQCSVCGMHFRYVYDHENADHFCRHCGAEMDGLEVQSDEVDRRHGD